MEVNPLRHFWLAVTERLGILFFCLCSLSVTGNNKTTDNLVATGTIDQPLALAPYLEPIEPPVAANAQTDAGGSSWFQLKLVLSPDFSTDWLLVFRRIPHKTLDVYIPADQQYQLHSLGINRLTPVNNDARTLKLPLNSGQEHQLLIKVHADSAGQLAPELWPEALYTLSEYRYHALSASLQTIMLTLLAITLAAGMVRRTLRYLPLSVHLAMMNLLLVALNGHIFRVMPWSISPGQVVSTITTLSMLTALACYLRLFRHARLTPKSTIILSGATLVSCGLMLGFIATSHTTPSLPLVLLLSLQAISLAILNFLLQPQQQQDALTINLIKGNQTRRRVFSQQLRENLNAAGYFRDEKELVGHIFATIDSTLHETPAVLLSQESGEWYLNSSSAKAEKLVAQGLDHFVAALTQQLSQNNDDQVHFQDKSGNSYWGFLLNNDSAHTLYLLLLPGKYQQEAITRQQALDVCSHIRMLLQSNRQTRYWQLQASLDSLTGLLNRSTFFREAERQIDACIQQHTPCCLLFIDIDDFKHINDHFGHPAGDRVLNEIAQRIKSHLRQQDLIARYGGEEFIILLPGASPWQGAQVAERIRGTVERYEISPAPVTLSLGLAALTPEVTSLTQLIREADNAMYAAKKYGKNRVEYAPSCSDLRLGWPGP